MYMADILKLEPGSLIFTSYYEAYIFIDVGKKSDQIVATLWETRGNKEPVIHLLDSEDCFVLKDNQTFPLTGHQFENIHRYFGGNAACEDSVRTVDTDGGVMNDLYDTKAGLLIVVHEHGCAIWINEEAYLASWQPLASYSWDEPLMSAEELNNGLTD